MTVRKIDTIDATAHRGEVVLLHPHAKRRRIQHLGIHRRQVFDKTDWIYERHFDLNGNLIGLRGYDPDGNEKLLGKLGYFRWGDPAAGKQILVTEDWTIEPPRSGRRSPYCAIYFCATAEMRVELASELRKSVSPHSVVELGERYPKIERQPLPAL